MGEITGNPNTLSSMKHKYDSKKKRNDINMSNKKLRKITSMRNIIKV